MTNALEPELAHLLMRIVQADGGRFEDIPVSIDPSTGDAELVGVDFDGQAKVGLLQELDARGCIDMRRPPSKIVGPLRVTQQGRELAQRITTSAAASAHRRAQRGLPSLGALNWRTHGEPLLRQITTRWVENDRRGLSGTSLHRELMPEESEASFVGLIQELRDQGWVSYRNEARPVPAGIEPTPKGRAFVLEWPTSDPSVFAEALLSKLERQIDDMPDDEDRTKLRRAWEALRGIVRDGAVDVGAAVVARQLGA